MVKIILEILTVEQLNHVGHVLQGYLNYANEVLVMNISTSETRRTDDYRIKLKETIREVKHIHAKKKEESNEPQRH